MAKLRTDPIDSEGALAAVARSLGAESVNGLTPAESAIPSHGFRPGRTLLRELRQRIRAGDDPLGEIFCRLRSPRVRRDDGAVYTPGPIVESMIDWSAAVTRPARVVDPGAGSGRFLLAAGRRFPKAELNAVELDPLAALVCRANLAVSGLARRAVVRVEDIRSTVLQEIDGPTLFIGNPPYVRHHQIDARWKRWLKREAAACGLKASALAGLHVHFFLAIARLAKHGDRGALITSAEWLDVNYGQLVRDLFVDRLGGCGVAMIAPEVEAFPGTQATAAITTFQVGNRSVPRLTEVKRLSGQPDLDRGRRVSRERLAATSRWSDLVRSRRRMPRGFVELGELCRVHRGQVTGANRAWIAGEHSTDLPDDVLFPAVTRARELIANGSVLSEAERLRRVIDLPAELSQFSKGVRRAIEQFLSRVEQMGARDTYIARHRRPWWSVGLRDPAPILATYMARRPPAFVLNRAGVRHLNIAHGLYPREPINESTLRGLVRFLRQESTTQGGRVYAGGLTKFEPREMERIAVPRPEMLLE